jgi:hypothetical protein
LTQINQDTDSIPIVALLLRLAPIHGGRPGTNGLKLARFRVQVHRENAMKYRTRILQMTMLALLASAGLATPSQAETGAVRVVFTKAGFVVGVGGGRGVLTFRGHNYPFTVSGASLGFTIGASTTQLSGRALNIRGPGDIAGTYSAIGAGGALAAGAQGVQLQNANGVILQLSGAKVGVELSAALAGVTITMQ